MSKRKNSVVRPALTPVELWIARFGLALALGISIYLLWNSLQGGSVPGCGPDSGCDKVLSSRWAYVFGFPVSGFALPVYVALLALLFQKNFRWNLLLPLGIVVLLAGLWFVGLQAFAIGAFCKFCMTAHLAGVIAGLMLLKGNPLPLSASIRSSILAVTGVTVIAGLQFASPAPAPKTVHAAPLTPTAASPAPNAAKPHTITIVEGSFTLDADKLPLTGPANAPKKLVKLFDYSCHHCRDLHHLLEAFRARYSNELAVISLPVPLNKDCNPIVKRTAPDHVNACDYARMGLAVFRANPAKFSEFTDWIFAPDRPPSVNEVRAHAEQLVGSREFNEALNSPVIDEQISFDVKIYVTSSRMARSGALPQMLFESGGSIGAVHSMGQLEQIMADNLGLGAPTAKP